MSEESDIAVLKEQLRALKVQVGKDELTYINRINKLETRADKIEARIRLGRGIFIGIFFTLGTIGFTAADKISNAIMKYF